MAVASKCMKSGCIDVAPQRCVVCNRSVCSKHALVIESSEPSKPKFYACAFNHRIPYEDVDQSKKLGKSISFIEISLGLDVGTLSGLSSTLPICDIINEIVANREGKISMDTFRIGCLVEKYPWRFWSVRIRTF